jgi:uncharacterized protein YjbI with pentapeptide repeats
VYLTDFGIALAMRDFDSARTQTVGTLAYMAPEQIEGTGGVASVRTDIYGLGVVLYQMLTGQLPFRDDSPVKLREAILSGTPMPFSTDSPVALHRICLRALARNPAERYPSANDLAKDLDRFLVPKRRWPVRIGVGLVLVLLLAGVVAWSWWRGKQDEAWSRSGEALVEVEKATDAALSQVQESFATTLEERAKASFAVTDGEQGGAAQPESRVSPMKDDTGKPPAIPRFASSVNLSGRDLTDADFKQLAGGMFVRRLNLSGTPTNDDRLGLLQAAMLEDLNLSGTKVSDAGLRHLSMLPAVMHLCLANTDITDEGIKTLGSMRLRTLDLSGTKITDAGLAHLGNAYGVAGQLHSLNLSNTAIMDHSVESLRKLSRLERLDLRQTKVTDSGIQAIREALPDCVVQK